VSGWQIHLHEGPNEWARDIVRLTIFRRDGDGGGQQIVGWDDGCLSWETEDVLPGAQLRAGFPIPAEALDSLREQLKPEPSLLDALGEALEIERARVGDMLGALHAHLRSDPVLERWADGITSRVDRLDRAVHELADAPPDGSDEAVRLAEMRWSVEAACRDIADLHRRWAEGETGMSIGHDLKRLAIIMGEIIGDAPPASETLDRAALAALRRVVTYIREGHASSSTEKWEAWMSELQRIAGPPGPDE
jgi:hypothetical protein